MRPCAQFQAQDTQGRRNGGFDFPESGVTRRDGATQSIEGRSAIKCLLRPYRRSRRASGNGDPGQAARSCNPGGRVRLSKKPSSWPTCSTCLSKHICFMSLMTIPLSVGILDCPAFRFIQRRYGGLALWRRVTFSCRPIRSLRSTIARAISLRRKPRLTACVGFEARPRGLSVKSGNRSARPVGQVSLCRKPMAA